MKDLTKHQDKLQEAKLERERLKARYDAHATILEGHRANIIALEKQSNEILDQWKLADQKVVKASEELQNLIEKEHESNSKEDETER